ncbi:uncharacterized protein LOC34618256 [Cyclospora cayetanensis]|uniref:Uncharacterized protein LOC34618256 n=1 Tax=Cyclospora cayetanensis TaxID=88456 RepID=A0A6P6S0B2_9EIME|nr:uncharacterized protein LOC34618256 [Cyclospora cayetanensis]
MQYILQAGHVLCIKSANNRHMHIAVAWKTHFLISGHTRTGTSPHRRMNFAGAAGPRMRRLCFSALPKFNDIFMSDFRVTPDAPLPAQQQQQVAQISSSLLPPLTAGHTIQCNAVQIAPLEPEPSATGAATFAAAALAPLALFFISALLIIPAAFVCLHRSSSASTSVSSGRSSSSSSGGPSPFDLAFSFDLHCNGSFVFAMYTQVVPLLLQPLLLLLPAPVRKWLAAALHCYGFWCYTYVSAMGYLAVGRLKSAAPLLLSAFGCIAVVICCAAAGVDLSFCPTRLVLQAMLNTAPVEPAVVAVPAITTAQPDLPLQ